MTFESFQLLDHVPMLGLFDNWPELSGEIEKWGITYRLLTNLTKLEFHTTIESIYVLFQAVYNSFIHTGFLVVFHFSVQLSLSNTTKEKKQKLSI